MRQTNGVAVLARFGVAAAIAAAALTGCAGYSSYPPLKGDTAFNNTNSGDMVAVMAVGMRWMVDRYPVEGEFAVNLPEGMTRRRSLEVLAQMGSPNARPLTPETAHLPTFHVARVVVRISDAEVDIVRPVATFSDREQRPINQLVTVRVKGGLSPWRAFGEKPYLIGAAETPPLRFIPSNDPPGLSPGPSASDMERRVEENQRKAAEADANRPPEATAPRRQAP